MSSVPGQPVPLTALTSRYWETKKGGATGLHNALTGPEGGTFAERLAREFEASVRLFSERGFAQPTEPFRPSYATPEPKSPEEVPAEDGADPNEVKNAREFATALFRADDKTLHVAGSPELSASYVDYEISLLRTTGDARFDHEEQRKAGRALIADLLLRSPDNFPVITEVKYGLDATPILGAIQVLTYAAHLTAERHYARLSAVPKDAPARDPFRAWDADGPVLDAYVVVVDPPDGKPGKVGDLHGRAPEFIAELAAQPAVKRVIRNFKLLRVTTDEVASVLDGDGKISADLLA